MGQLDKHGPKISTVSRSGARQVPRTGERSEALLRTVLTTHSTITTADAHKVLFLESTEQRSWRLPKSPSQIANPYFQDLRRVLYDVNKIIAAHKKLRQHGPPVQDLDRRTSQQLDQKFAPTRQKAQVVAEHVSEPSQEDARSCSRKVAQRRIYLCSRRTQNACTMTLEHHRFDQGRRRAYRCTTRTFYH